jgi:hypothetical protein
MSIELTRKEALATIAAVEKALRDGHPPAVIPGSHTMTAARVAAHALGIDRRTVHSRIQAGGSIDRLYGLRVDWSKYKAPEAPKPFAPDDRPPPTRAEVQGADFWRRRASLLERELATTERVLGQVSGLASQEIEPPEWLAAAKDVPAKRAIIGCLVSDVHMGEVIASDEIQGVNEFNPEIARARLRRYFEAAAAIGPRWGSDTDLLGCFIAFAGDLVSGDIHEELARTNALTSNEQVRAMVECAVAGIRLMKETFGKVHCVFVPGNHGRQTHKPTAKLYARLSYDTLIGQFVSDVFAGDKDVTFQIANSRDAITPIFGRSIFTTHGDGMGTSGGQGFAGPLLPIVRGTKKVEAQQARMNRRPDLILHGHYHHSANPGPVLSNGAIPGYGEYANGLRASFEPPQQWLFLFHEKWGLRERSEIKLEAPGAPPPVRIPAVMERS